MPSYLGPDRLVPIDGRIKLVSAKAGEADASSYEQTRAIYDYVIANMTYDKTGNGWGRGDAIYACNVKKGNCSDFHSLFIAIARSRGIPARFTIGFPIGAPSVGEIPGYHCWAEFYTGGQWVTVDASEAWKHPQLRNYYFGHLEDDRVAFTMGRDLALKPRQSEEPVSSSTRRLLDGDSKRRRGITAANFQTEELVARRALAHCAHIHPATPRTGPYSIAIVAQTGSGQ